MLFQKLFLKSCVSTNEFLKSSEFTEIYSAVFSFHQTKGKGQRGNLWENGNAENIAISLGIPKSDFSLNPVEISMFTANFTRHFIQSLLSEKVYIKWPNDLIVSDKKIAGILIEETKELWILGIGINVNTLKFKNLPNAISLAQLSHRNYDLKELTTELITLVEGLLPIEKQGIADLYNHFLYRKGSEIQFQLANSTGQGTIQKVNTNGELVVQLKNRAEPQNFKHGEIQMLL